MTVSSARVIKAVGEMLVYSLWQGLALALITGLIMVATRKSTAAKRYNLLVAALSLFTVSTIFTFAHALLNPRATVHFAAALTQANVQKFPLTKIPIGHLQSVNFWWWLRIHFSRNINLIVLIWFLIICIRSLQFIWGLHGLSFYRKKSVLPVDESWGALVKKLAQKMGIRQIVSIMESGLAKVPMAIGHLKPLILVPAGILTMLPPAEIEAILIHELAHIRRRDFLVNLLQNLLEIVFFFNPAVIWISALIKTERENCCDDIAIAETSNKINYIRALVSCQQYQLNTPAYAMALKGKPGHLSQRVKRMVNNSNQSLNALEKSLLTICLVTAGIFILVFSTPLRVRGIITGSKKVTPAVEQKKTKKTAEILLQASGGNISAPEIKEDTVQPEKPMIYHLTEISSNRNIKISNNGFISYITKKTGVLYQLNYKGTDLFSMQVNGKTVDKSEIKNYQPVIDKMLTDDEGTLTPEEQQAADEELSADKESYQTPPVYYETSYPVTVKPKVYFTVKPTVDIAKKLPLTYKINRLDHSNPTTISYTTNIEPYHNTYPKTAAGEPSKSKLIAMLIENGVVNNENQVTSFKLSTEEFILNGEKQPDGIFKQLRNQFVPATGSNSWAWFYNFDSSKEIK